MNKVELQKAIGDIYYEIQMLSRSYTEYWKHEASDRLRLPKWIHHSVIEATLIHTRALLDFFERPRPKAGRKKRFCADDVFADDYGFSPAPVPLSDKLRKRINTRIAHLSFCRTRVIDSDRHWDFATFVPQILVRSAEFFQHLVDSGHALPPDLDSKKIQTLMARGKALNTCDDPHI